MVSCLTCASPHAKNEQDMAPTVHYGGQRVGGLTGSSDLTAHNGGAWAPPSNSPRGAMLKLTSHLPPAYLPPRPRQLMVPLLGATLTCGISFCPPWALTQRVEEMAHCGPVRAGLILSDQWLDRLALERVCSLLSGTTGYMPGRPSLGPHSCWALAHSLKAKVYLHIWTAPSSHVLLHVTLTSPEASTPGPWRGVHWSFWMVNRG